MIDLLKAACLNDGTKPELECINIVNIDGNIQSVTATDAFRLHQINGLRTGFEPGMYKLEELWKYEGIYPDTNSLQHPEDLYFEGSSIELVNKIESLSTGKIRKIDVIYIETENYTLCFNKKYIEDAIHFIHEMSHTVDGNIQVFYSKNWKNKFLKISVGDNKSGAFALIMPM